MPRAHELLARAAGGGGLTTEDMEHVLAHVLRSGFDPYTLERARGNTRHSVPERFASPEQIHYLRHVIVGREWPEGTTIQEYVETARRVVEDPNSGVFISRYGGTLQLGLVGTTPELSRGDNGQELLLAGIEEQAH